MMVFFPSWGNVDSNEMSERKTHQKRVYRFTSWLLVVKTGSSRRPQDPGLRSTDREMYKKRPHNWTVKLMWDKWSAATKKWTLRPQSRKKWKMQKGRECTRLKSPLPEMFAQGRGRCLDTSDQKMTEPQWRRYATLARVTWRTERRQQRPSPYHIDRKPVWRSKGRPTPGKKKKNAGVLKNCQVK